MPPKPLTLEDRVNGLTATTDQLDSAMADTLRAVTFLWCAVALLGVLVIWKVKNVQ